MSQKTRNQLIEQSTVIRQEVQKLANKKTRVADIIDAIGESSLNAIDDKASEAEAIAGVNNAKYLTPALVKSILAPFILRITDLEEQLPSNLLAKMKGKSFKLYADSIGYGQGADDPATNSWFAFFTKYLGGTANVNHGVPGHTVAQQNKLLAADMLTSSRDFIAAYMVGINNVRTNPYYNTHSEVLIEAFTYFICQAFIKESFSSTQLGLTPGNGWNESVGQTENFNVKYYPSHNSLNFQNLYFERTFTGTACALCYAGESECKFRVYIDGVLWNKKGLLDTAGNPYTDNTLNDSGNGSTATRANLAKLFTGLSEGQHTFRFETFRESGESYTTSINIDELLILGNPSNYLPAFIGHLPPFDLTYAGTTLSAGRLTIINNAITELHASIKALGYPLGLVKFSEYQATPAQAPDKLHPSGHSEDVPPTENGYLAYYHDVKSSLSKVS